MSIPIGPMLADAYDRAMTLAGYGFTPLTVGWWRDKAFVRVWNYRTGQTEWRPFTTSRKPQSPRSSPFFADSALYRTLTR